MTNLFFIGFYQKIIINSYCRNNNMKNLKVSLLIILNILLAGCSSSEQNHQTKTHDRKDVAHIVVGNNNKSLTINGDAYVVGNNKEKVQQ